MIVNTLYGKILEKLTIEDILDEKSININLDENSFIITYISKETLSTVILNIEIFR